jgi:uncharacterized peroxidase-related enzyme
MLAHGALLRKNFFRADEMAALLRDFRTAGLPPQEVALMSFAQKVALRPHDLSEVDVAELRGHGLSDEEVLDVVLTAAARSFFSRTLEAVAAPPDSIYAELEPELLELLAAGRPLA